jgi:hypothetical protein
MMKVYPIGYSTPGASQRIDELMQQERMLLIDTRYSSYSWNPMWRHDALQEKYGKRYRWAGRLLGNVNYQGGPIKIANPETGIAGLRRYLEEGYDLILLCQCKDYQICHRKTVVEMLLQEMPEVEVIQPDESVQVASDTVMALSIRQPYAHWLSNPDAFIRAGVPPKTIENRDWNTRYRGLLLIHASATFEHDAIDHWCWQFGKLVQAAPVEEKAYPTGAIVGIADLVDVVTKSNDPWFVGTYGFVLANARAIEPIPYRGALKLFPVPTPVVDAVLKESKQ